MSVFNKSRKLKDMIKNNKFRMMAAAFFTAAIVGCGNDIDFGQQYNALIDEQSTEKPDEETPKPAPASGYNEQYRPQVHYTPAQNWVNDPNGLVFADGTYHLFYQYNPQGNDWGNMSWGHATSPDLIHWKEQPVALMRDELGDVFSGSCVIDNNNTAGFGAGAMVAIYTSAGSAGQQQSVAYSTDGGKNFTRYPGNPVISNNDDNQRDPKVFWHAPSKKWVMALAKGWAKGVEFYGSTDLKSWSFLSKFVVDLPGRWDLQWECPDLIQLDGKWVLIVSVNPMGPLVGSGMMYFVGDFDGTTFTAEPQDYPLWYDYGMDNYAGVTWSNTGDRKIMIGWMNNWTYCGNVPCTPWRSAFTLPRELKLTKLGGKYILGSTVVSEIDGIAGDWQQTSGSINTGHAYQLRVKVSLTEATTITLSNGQGEKFDIDVSPASRTLTAHRTAASGEVKFHDMFSIPSMQAPLNVEGSTVTLDIFVDQSSIEIFNTEGTLSMTNIVFPKSIYNRVDVAGATSECSYRQLKRIWE